MIRNWRNQNQGPALETKTGYNQSNTVPEGVLWTWEVQRNLFHKWLETYLGYNKIEGDWL